MSAIMPDCYYCGVIIPGTPVYADDDPLRRTWCSPEHLEASAEASYEQRYQPAGDPVHSGWRDSPEIPRFGADENDLDDEVDGE
jgi:hypothetical protein